MKVGVIGSVGVPARYGGFETMAEQLVKHVSPNTCFFVVYCQKSAYSEVERLDDESVAGHKRVFVPLKANGGQSLFYDAWAILHSIVIERVDVVLILGYSGAWILPLIRMISRDVKVVTNVDGMEWRRDKFGRLAKSLLKALEFFAVKFSNTVVVDNAALLPLLNSRYVGANPFLIAYGGDHTLVDPVERRGFNHEGYYFSVARIEPENNCHLILEAFSRASSEKLVFVGNWAASTYGKGLREKFSNVQNIVMLDPVYDLAELSWLRASAVGYIHGHSVGGTNPSLVEAVFHSSKIIAYDCAFNRETLLCAGWYFSSVEDLCDRLLIRGVVDNLGDSAQLLREKYRWSNIASEYLSVFKS